MTLPLPPLSPAGTQKPSTRMPEGVWRAAFDGIHDGVLLLRTDGTPLAWNRAFVDMVGVDEDQVFSLSFSRDLSAEAQQQTDFERLVLAAAAGEPQVVDWKMRRPADNSVFDVHIAFRGVRWETTPVVVLTLRDRTDRTAVQERLVQAQRMESLATVVGGIAHEFNNILNNVLGFATLIKKYIHDHTKALKYSQAIEQSVQRGGEVTKRLLAFARMEDRAPEPVPMAPLLAEVAERIQRECPEDVTVVRRFPEVLPEVLGVRAELVQALLNLCLNARDAIIANAVLGGRGTLTIDAAPLRVSEELSPTLSLPPGEECLTIRIIDNGIGIRHEIADRIFDPFFTTKQRGHGTGLGLSIVYTIVRGHHGAVVVDSHVGKGSTFLVHLPVHDARRRQVLRNESPGARSTELILLVDDERGMLEFGRDVLVEHGYRVMTAADGREALELYRKHAAEISLVVLDLIMPQLDGGQTYLEMKRINRSVKAVFCSGYTSEGVIAALLEEEHLRSVRKPFQIEELLTAVRQTLDAPRYDRTPPTLPLHSSG